jgi:hypothetical protein
MRRLWLWLTVILFLVVFFSPAMAATASMGTTMPSSIGLVAIDGPRHNADNPLAIDESFLALTRNSAASAMYPAYARPGSTVRSIVASNYGNSRTAAFHLRL